MYGKYDDDNDVSRIFVQKTERQFRKDFAKFLPPEKRDSLAKVNELNVKLIESDENISSLKRTLESKTREIEELKVTEQLNANQINELRKEISQLKASFEQERRVFKSDNDEKLKEKFLLDDYRDALNKYMTWFLYSKKQLDMMKEFLEEHGGWTEENRYKIYFAYKAIDPMKVKDEEVAELCKTQVLDYQGIEDIESISEFEQHLKFSHNSTQTDDNLESGFIQHSDESSRNPSSQGFYISNSQPLDTSFHNVSAEDLKIFEHDEKIQKLECDNASMKEQLVILGQKARQSALLEEQKRDLENQLSIYRRHNAELIDEAEKLKATFRSTFSKDMELNEVNDIIRKLTELRERNEVLEKQVKECETLKSSSKSSTEEAKEERERIAQFLKEKYRKEIDELKKKLAEYEPLQHPSDTTRVYRFEANNPLDEAHEEHWLNEASAAAKASTSGAGCSGLKRRKMSGPDEENLDESSSSEAIRELRSKLEQHERSLRLQKEMALQYRQVVAALTGYQIKMREEGMCEVQCIYDMGGELCFQRRSDDGMDLLDNECARRWKSHIDDYLAKYDSIPAFLASVLLSLVENDASMLSSTFLNYTKEQNL